MDDVTALRDALVTKWYGSDALRVVFSADLDALIAAVEARAALTPEPLAKALDEHWLECDGPTWYCTCGEWTMGTLGFKRSDAGKHLYPFTLHCAEATLAALATPEEADRA